MNRVVAFSGGFDSTLLACKVIKSISNNSDKIGKDKVTLFSIVNDITGNKKNLRESSSRYRIYQKLVEMNPEVKIDYQTIEIKMDHLLDTWKSGNHGIAQPMLWASAIVPILHDGDVVYFGYNAEDHDHICKLPYIKKMLKSMAKLQNIDYGYKVKFKFPLSMYSKTDILRELRAVSEELFDLCTSCESIGILDHCGSCNPCNHLKQSLINLCIENNSDSYFYKEKLYKWFNVNFEISDYYNCKKEDEFNVTSE